MLTNFQTDLREILKKKKVNLIIFGETHGFLQDNLIQEEIIQLFNPEMFVYEMLEEEELLTKKARQEFLNKKDREDFSVISTYQDLKPTVKLAKKYNLPILGNDIKNMGRKNKDFLKKTKLNKQELKEEERILSRREKRQVKIIWNLLKKQEKVFVTTGAFHLREDSPLMNLKCNYLVVYPLYNKKQLFEPPRSFDEKKVNLKIKEVICR